MVALMLVSAAVANPTEVHARSKFDRLSDAVGDYKKQVRRRDEAMDNQKFAEDHPEEGKICFDTMMEVADKHGVKRQDYFGENQEYFRSCIEHMLAAKQ
ncbi:MAG: hypothetical protein MK052_05470 [Alphaproteobacteria bacterium]|nr:hypothetical protein [Alphaproteobacteria bacterium]